MEAHQPHLIPPEHGLGALQSSIQRVGDVLRGPGVRRCCLAREPRIQVASGSLPQRRGLVSDQFKVDEQPGPGVALRQQPIGSDADVVWVGRCQQAPQSPQVELRRPQTQRPRSPAG